MLVVPRSAIPLVLLATILFCCCSVFEVAEKNALVIQLIRDGDVALEGGDFRRAYENYERARRLAEKIPEPDLASLAATGVANVRMAQHRYREAVGFFLKATAYLLDTNSIQRDRIAELFVRCGDASIQADLPAKGAKHYTMALSLTENPVQTSSRQVALRATVELALLQLERGDLAGGRDLLNSAEKIYRDLQTEFPHMAWTVYSLGYQVAHQSGDITEAIAQAKKMADNSPPGMTPVTSISLCNAAKLEGLYDDALIHCSACRDAIATSPGVDRSRIASILNVLGYIHLDRGEAAEAEALFLEAVEINKSIFGAKASQTARVMDSLGEAETQLGKHEEAEKLHKKALEIMLRVWGDDTPTTAYIGENLARARSGAGKSEAALKGHQQALAKFDTFFPGDHQEKARVLHGMGLTLKTMGKLDEARKSLEEARSMRARIFPDNHPLTAKSAAALSELNAGGDGG